MNTQASSLLSFDDGDDDTRIILPSPRSVTDEDREYEQLFERLDGEVREFETQKFKISLIEYKGSSETTRSFWNDLALDQSFDNFKTENIPGTDITADEYEEDYDSIDFVNDVSKYMPLNHSLIITMLMAVSIEWRNIMKFQLQKRYFSSSFSDDLIVGFIHYTNTAIAKCYHYIYVMWRRGWKDELSMDRIQWLFELAFYHFENNEIAEEDILYRDAEFVSPYDRFMERIPFIADQVASYYNIKTVTRKHVQGVGMVDEAPAYRFRHNNPDYHTPLGYKRYPDANEEHSDSEEEDDEDDNEGDDKHGSSSKKIRFD